MTGMHGKLPKRFPNDLSRKAIARMYSFNLYSAFVVYGGLCDRLNEILSQYGLRGKMSNALAVTMCIFLGASPVGLGWYCCACFIVFKNQDAYNQAISAEHTILGQPLQSHITQKIIKLFCFFSRCRQFFCFLTISSLSCFLLSPLRKSIIASA